MSSPENHLSFSLLLIFSLLTLTFSQSLSSENHLLLPSNWKFGQDDQLFCESWRFSVETNDAGIWYTIPTRCFDFVKNYVTSDRYLSDSEVVAGDELAFAKSVDVSGDGKDAWIFDVDETLLFNLPYYEDHGYGNFGLFRTRNNKMYRSFPWMLQHPASPWLNENPESGPMVLNSISDLATSCQLQYLHFGGYLCEHLAAGGVTKSPPLSFNYLSKLCLSEIKLGWVDVCRFVIGMIQSCPCIKVLEISGFGATPEGTDVSQREIDYDDSIDSYKLGHLTKVEFTGITGSSAELKFIEYLLAISEVLELFLFKCKNLNPTSELKVSRDLLRLGRASSKAQLICMKY